MAKTKGRARSGKRWVRTVKTESTFPPKGVFVKDARTVARVLGSKKVSPKGIGSGIRMIQYFINRGGKGLSPTRRETLERAKRILQRKRARTAAAKRGAASRSRAAKNAVRTREK